MADNIPEALIRAGQSLNLNKEDLIRKIQGNYFNYAQNGYQEDIWELEQLSSIEMSLDTFQKIGHFYITQRGEYLSYLKNLMERKKDFKLGSLNVLTGLISYLEQGKFENYNELKKISKVGDKEQEQIVLAAYNKLLKAHKVGTFLNLYNQTKIQPKVPKEIVNQVSLRLLKDGRMKDAQELLEINQMALSEAFFAALIEYDPSKIVVSIEESTKGANPTKNKI
jgi:hypothetical protein